MSENGVRFDDLDYDDYQDAERVLKEIRKAGEKIVTTISNLRTSCDVPLNLVYGEESDR